MADGELNVDSLITRLLEGEHRAASRENGGAGGRRAGLGGSLSGPSLGPGGAGRLGGSGGRAVPRAAPRGGEGTLWGYPAGPGGGRRAEAAVRL